MTWKQNLRRASFRGVTFHVRDRTMTTGRAIHVHEYPKRDLPFAEDMGRDTRKFTVDAYVIGDDYMSRRDQLVAACEKVGEASYVDHWGRSLTVVCEGCDLKESSEEGRLARLSLKFTEAGTGSAPTAIAATAAQLSGASSSLATAGLVSFAKLGIVTQTPLPLATAAGITLPDLAAQIVSRAAGSVLGR